MDANNQESLIDNFIKNLQLNKYENEQQKAESSMELLEKILTITVSVSAREYLNALGLLRTVLQIKFPLETTPMNMILKAIKIIKDEYISLRNVEAEAKEIASRSFPHCKPSDPCPPDLWNSEVDAAQFKDIILEAIIEQKAEIEQCQEVIASQGPSKIHNDEVILTGGYCPNVLAFLRRASKKRKFQVLVVESAPSFEGLQMAKSLSSASIETTIIQDSAVFALMSRVNKIVIGCRTVLCNGGIRSFVGAANIAAAAKFNNVSLHICAPTFTFSTERSISVNHFESPRAILPNGICDINLENVNITASKYDVVPPELITSFITNNLGITPFYIDRQVKDIFQPCADVF